MSAGNLLQKKELSICGKTNKLLGYIGKDVLNVEKKCSQKCRQSLKKLIATSR
jgi:hypothetical protein